MKLCSRRREILGPVTTPDSRTHTIDDVEGARSRLTFFKVMAFIVGVGLLVLVVEMVLSLSLIHISEPTRPY